MLVRKAATLPDRETVGNWLYGVARQTAVRMRAMAARRGVRERQVAVLPEPATAERHAWDDLSPVLDEELSRLPDKYRVLVVLCDLEGVTRKDAARRLGLPEGTAASRLAAARAMLARRLARRGVVVSSGLLGSVLSQQSAWAGVPTAVMASTFEAATLVAAGHTVAGAASPTVTALTIGVTKAMFVTKIKTVLAVVLVVGLLVGGIGTAALVALAAPTPKETKKLDPPTAKELKASQNNLEQIGIAFHRYIFFARDECPNNLVDQNGKPTLSWRVLLLPYLGEEKLFKKFMLDEPWDSKTNKALIEKMPRVFAPIRVKAEKGETFYRGFSGADTAFETGKLLKFTESFRDGTSNTILVVEAGEPCIWTKPDDLPFDNRKALPKLGGLFDGDFHVLIGDGTVAAGKSSKMNAGEFKKMITLSDGKDYDPAAALGIEKE